HWEPRQYEEQSRRSEPRIARRGVAMTDTKSGPPSYKVGYSQPPVEHQFRKGVSGNPKGRGKGTKNFATIFMTAMTKSVTITENGKRKKISKLAAAANSQGMSARKWRCASHTSRSTIASSACVFGVSPAPATSSTLRPSCKILRHSQ